MIIVRLQGGMSNQFFQYAVGRSLALKRNTKLTIDTSWYDEAAQADGVGKRVYELYPYAIQENFYKNNPLNKVYFKVFGNGTYMDEEQPYIFHPEVLELPNNTKLFGYFQNEKYFTDIRDILVKEFTLKEPPTGKNAKLIKEISASPTATSVHVRRADYVTSKAHAAHHGSKDVEYYQTALDRLKKQVKNPDLYAFSDDPEWCKQNLKLGSKTTFVDHNTFGGEDMRLMRACKHNILANSSFSWWGAWLNENPDKIVIGPKQWLNNSDMDASDVMPKSWIRI